MSKPEESLSQLEEIREKVKGIKGKRDKLIIEQYDLLHKKIVELKPVIDFVLQNGYNFMHPSINLSYPGGPLLMEDRDSSLVFAYNVETRMVKVFSSQTGAYKEDIKLYDFVSRYDIRQAMVNLNELNNLPEQILNAEISECDNRETTLNIFK